MFCNRVILCKQGLHQRSENYQVYKILFFFLSAGEWVGWLVGWLFWA